MDLQVKNLKADSSTTVRQKPLLLLIITSKAAANYSFPLVKGDDNKNLFQNVLFEVNFFKACNRSIHFLLEGPFGDFEHTPGGCNYYFMSLFANFIINIYIQ